MSTRKYYSSRTGIGNVKLDLFMLRQLLLDEYKHFEEQGYFQEFLGFYCVDGYEVPGKLGTNINRVLISRVHKTHLWPLAKGIADYSEDDVLDMIEFLFDHVSKPSEEGGTYHNWENCGWHYVNFDQAAGQHEFRESVNQFLQSYENGFEISEDGDVNHLSDTGLQPLFQAPIPPCDMQNVASKIDSAKKKFQRFKSSAEDKRDAVRELADVAEFLRADLKTVLTGKDESDLFNIANNFSIRHHNENQKSSYDLDIWLDWMFHHYLSTIHTSLRLIEKKNSVST